MEWSTSFNKRSGLLGAGCAALSALPLGIRGLGSVVKSAPTNHTMLFELKSIGKTKTKRTVRESSKSIVERQKSHYLSFVF